SAPSVTSPLILAARCRRSRRLSAGFLSSLHTQQLFTSQAQRALLVEFNCSRFRVLV
ncbi:hypothetical protein PIB30_095549, partial [Stylosanthes scabra]|nr:hypothetical protein [Stylosanthes scabra]